MKKKSLKEKATEAVYYVVSIGGLIAGVGIGMYIHGKTVKM